MNRAVPNLSTFKRTFKTPRFVKGAVVTNGPKCAEIGASILNQGGTAMEAVIAAMLSEGVVVPNSMGLGGGFIMTIYSKQKGTVETLDCREVAPKNATEDMFCTDGCRVARGGLAVAVPGELKGYWEAYKKYGGSIPWKDLVQPSLDLCKNGFPMNHYLKKMCLLDLDVLKNDELLRKTFTDGESKVHPVGHPIQRPKLAETLKLIQQDGADVLYNGRLTEKFVNDIQAQGGIITTEDMNSYKPEFKTPIEFSLSPGKTLHTTPLPGSGLILAAILNILKGFLDPSSPDSLSNWNKIIESFKFAFGRRTELGDPGFTNFKSIINCLTSKSCADEIRKLIHENKTYQDLSYYGASIAQTGHGTSNICVLASNGDAVAASSSINLSWGAGFMSKSTGIILNDTMNDFSSPNVNTSFHLTSEANLIKPGKRPLTSMSPSIILGENGVEMVIGASGGPKIITSIALSIVKHLWFNYNIQQAVSERRLHHQLFPMLIEFEECFEKDKFFIKSLQEIGHKYKIGCDEGLNAVTAITKQGEELRAAFDPRRGGEKAFVF